MYPSGHALHRRLHGRPAVGRPAGRHRDLAGPGDRRPRSRRRSCPAPGRPPACSWQLGNYGAAWIFAPDHYPSGDEIFQTGALGNVNNYSDPAVDRLIVATTYGPASEAQAALDAYADQVRLQLPDFWQPSPGTLITVQSNLRGFTPNAYGFINPEQWYFTKAPG